jgi:hypothetical protein
VNSVDTFTKLDVFIEEFTSDFKEALVGMSGEFDNNARARYPLGEVSTRPHRMKEYESRL